MLKLCQKMNTNLASAESIIKYLLYITSSLIFDNPGLENSLPLFILYCLPFTEHVETLLARKSLMNF